MGAAFFFSPALMAVRRDLSNKRAALSDDRKALITHRKIIQIKDPT
jgi:hypothetical protein